jgi:cytochrome b561
VAAQHSAASLGSGAVISREGVRDWTGRVLYLSLFLIPLTGLSLLLISDDLLFAHIATHVLFFAALAAHLGLVLKHQFIDRDNLLGRMT